LYGFFLKIMPRPKCFDEEEVLQKAITLFQRKGYEATSVQDIVDTLCINRASLYDTFTDKRTLFLSALRKYQQLQCESNGAFLSQTDSVRQKIEFVFRQNICQMTVNPACQGCFLVNAAVELSANDREVAELVRQNRITMEENIRLWIEDGQTSGEISASHSPETLARFLVNTINGMSVMVKTGATQAELEQIAAVALSVL
jgi:TetR/AcrR family transcriptional regulator, transcriptional repressor for nem operon